MLEGYRVTEFVFWPTEGYWGYVNWDGPISVANIGAPYVCDLLTFGIFFSVCMLVLFKRRWGWINLIALGIISPLVNSYHNYRGGLQGPNDVGKLLKLIPDEIVHWYFWLTISLYALGLVIVFSLSRTARTQIQVRRTNNKKRITLLPLESLRNRDKKCNKYWSNKQ